MTPPTPDPTEERTFIVCSLTEEMLRRDRPKKRKSFRAWFLHFFDLRSGKRSCSRTIFILALVLPVRIFSQHLDSIARDRLDVALKRDFVSGYHWKDKRGDNNVILSQTKPFEKVEGSPMRYVEIRAVNLKSLATEKREIIWEYKDSQEKCHEVNNLIARFIRGSFTVTDLNNNGVCEVWFMYKMSCRTDISPARLKLVMHEGEKESVITGHTRVGRKDAQYLGGDHELDANFNAAEQRFADYGLELWEKFITEDWR
jgi:hypothetical protein